MDRCDREKTVARGAREKLLHVSAFMTFPYGGAGTEGLSRFIIIILTRFSQLKLTSRCWQQSMFDWMSWKFDWMSWMALHGTSVTSIVTARHRRTHPPGQDGWGLSPGGELPLSGPRLEP